MSFESVNKLFEKTFRDNWERPALSNYDGVTLRFCDVAKRIELLHIAFEQCGIQRGDKVAMCARNQANWAVCFFAVLSYGAVPVPLLHEFKPDSIHYLVNHSEAKVLFVDQTIWENLSESEMPGLNVIVQMNTLRNVYAISEKYADQRDKWLSMFRQKYPGDSFGPDCLDYYEDKPEDLAIINYTSGTSGFSKGVMLPYRSLWNNIRFGREEGAPQIHPGSQIVAILPSAHMYGLMFELLYQISQGAHIHFLNRLPSPKIIVKACQDIHPDLIISVPLVLEKVYKSMLKPEIEKHSTLLKLPIVSSAIQNTMREKLVDAFGGNFEEAILGGAALNPEVEDFMRKIRFPFTVGYGMTECGPIITYAHWNKCRKGSCGKIVGNMQLRIDSADPQNIPGEVQLYGANVFTGYWHNPEATAKAFTSDGWFRTGDMGVVDAQGYLYLRGRCKCMILSSNGQNIYPEELEAVINNVKYVVESLVIEDRGGLTALVFPDYPLAQHDGFDRKAIGEHLAGLLPEINKMLPAYAQIHKMEFLPEDFERTPKKSIKRYLYQRD